MKWLFIPGIVFLLAGAACSISLFRYYDDAVFWQEQVRDAEREGESGRAELSRSKAAECRMKNWLWGAGAGVGFLGGGAMILWSMIRLSSGGPRATKPRRETNG